MKFHRVLILREVVAEIDDLKRGDIFKFIPADDKDVVCPEGYYVADTDAAPDPDIEGNVMVYATEVELPKPKEKK